MCTGRAVRAVLPCGMPCDMPGGFVFSEVKICQFLHLVSAMGVMHGLKENVAFRENSHAKVEMSHFESL